MASHSAYPHLLQHHPHPSAHLPPPPLPAALPNAPSQRLPSLRSLNFAYHPVADPASTPIEPSPQQPRSPFAQQHQVYYHHRDNMSYYQDASSSAPQAQPALKRPRSASNTAAQRSFSLQQAHQDNPVYQTQSHEPRHAGATSFPQAPHPQAGHAQYAPAPHHQQQPDSAPQPSYYGNRMSQPSHDWYYSPGHQSQQQQQQQQQQAVVHGSPQKALPFQQYSVPAPVADVAGNPQHASPQPPPPLPPPPATGPRAAYPNGTDAAPHQQHPHHQHQHPAAPPDQGSAAPAAAAADSSSPAAAPGATPTAVLGTPPTPAFASSGSALAHAVPVDSKALEQDAERAAAAGMHLNKITEHSSILCDFANRYGQMPHMRPSSNEVAEMAQRASLVLQLVEHLRRMASALQSSPGVPFALSSSEKEREDGGGVGEKRKKRQWDEDEHHSILSSAFGLKDSALGAATTMRTVADEDMAIIRSKRGHGPAGAGGGVPGQTKPKYRKRSRATPPGRCHSCNSRETPEWRRGPDGARTLCNACGLHYAKLIRKRDKTLAAHCAAGTDVHLPPIDLDTLRQATQHQMPPSHPHHPQPHHPQHQHQHQHAHHHPGHHGGVTKEFGGVAKEFGGEIHLQPVGGGAGAGAGGAAGTTIQVHQWTPPHHHESPRQPNGAGATTAATSGTTTSGTSTVSAAAAAAAAVAATATRSYELGGVFSTSLIRSSNARASPA